MKKLCFCLLAAAFFCGGSYAESQAKDKTGFAIQSFGGNGWITNGLLIGARSVRYIQLLSNINVGWEFMAGTMAGTRLDSDNLTYGGLSIGYDGTLAKIFSYDVNVLTGFGWGRLGNLSSHGLVVQPQVALGFTLVGGYRASFGVGYLFMPNVPSFENLNFTIRLEFKSTDSSSGTNG